MSDKTRKIKGSSGAKHSTGGYVPFSSSKQGAGHSDQPQGKSVGYSSKRSYAKGQATGAGSQAGQSWGMAGQKAGGHGHAKPSELAYNTNVDPKGSSFTGRLGKPDSFKNAGDAVGKAHGFRHEGGLRNGALRMSGDSRAHRIGSRKK